VPALCDRITIFQCHFLVKADDRIDSVVLWDCPCRPKAGSDNPVTMRYSSGWNREIESTLRGVGSDLRLLLVTGGVSSCFLQNLVELSLSLHARPSLSSAGFGHLQVTALDQVAYVERALLPSNHVHVQSRARQARLRTGTWFEAGTEFLRPLCYGVIANSFSIFNMEKAVRQRIREGHATWSVLTVRGAWLDPGRFYCSTRTWLPGSVRVHGYASGPLFRRNTTTALLPRNNAAAGLCVGLGLG
ncbi:hypothetical protein M514_26545, partial [Trichuris suis]